MILSLVEQKVKGHIGPALETDMGDATVCLVTLCMMNTSDKLVNKQWRICGIHEPGAAQIRYTAAATTLT